MISNRRTLLAIIMANLVTSLEFLLATNIANFLLNTRLMVCTSKRQYQHHAQYEKQPHGPTHIFN